MQNLTIAHWEQLTDYLEFREEFLCRPKHNASYLIVWSECFDYSDQIIDLFVKKLNIPCDCTALAAGRAKIARNGSSNTTNQNASSITATQ